MSDERPDDPWAAARTRQREEVGAALAPRPWTCSRCGAGNPAASGSCERCGESRAGRVGRYERSRRAHVAVGLAVLAVLMAAAVVVPVLREDAREFERAEEARLAAAVEAERRRLTIDARPRSAGLPRRRRGEPRLAHRERAVAAIERLVRADARERVRTGAMEGPVRGVSCSPFPKTETRAAAERLPGLRVARYTCNAYSSRIELPEVEGRPTTGLIGQPFWAVADYPDGRVTWCKVTPRAGEGGKVLAFVPVPEPCRDPAGPG